MNACDHPVSKEHLMDFRREEPQYWWTFGAILVMCLGIQIVTGVIWQCTTPQMSPWRSTRSSISAATSMAAA